MLVRASPAAEPWERFDLPIGHRRFGTGSIAAFRTYLEGPSRVRSASLAEVCDWLLTCQYESDESLFASVDYWQHPEQFERLKRGDCEDHALWAWRKLVEIGLPAQFVVGRYADSPVDSHGHAWVLCADRAQGALLIESVAKTADRIVRPLAEAAADYVPHFAVTHELRTVVFGGYLGDLQERARGESQSVSARGQRLGGHSTT
ncbi:MAG: transglutaminase-like cysteine peptidase [Gemmatimonadaceae bacterium]|nr:transglutaminase-like cysteine peptidase [Gemmatimonadaceae bacterium]